VAGGLDALQDDDGDLAFGSLLVFVVVRPDAIHVLPESFAFLAVGGTCACAETVAFDLNADFGVCAEVAVPAGLAGAPPFEATITTLSPSRS
jgi:hypothetical protein